MNITLKRHAYLKDRTMGTLYVGNEEFPTLERPWIKSTAHSGGKNFESCVPDGTYALQPFDSDNHHNVWSLMNADLDVFVHEPDIHGRWAILIHIGNYIKDIVGCIAPGMTGDDHNVWSSGDAINRLRVLLGSEDHLLIIEPKGATND